MTSADTLDNPSSPKEGVGLRTFYKFMEGLQQPRQVFSFIHLLILFILYLGQTVTKSIHIIFMIHVIYKYDSNYKSITIIVLKDH